MSSPITRGDLEPPLECTIGDAEGEADFSTVTPSQVRVKGWLQGTLLWELTSDSVTPVDDNKSLIIKRAWDAGETDQAGQVYLKAVVSWPGARPQSFPAEGYMLLEIMRDADDA